MATRCTDRAGDEDNGTEEQEQMNDTETNGKRQTERKERKK